MRPRGFFFPGVIVNRCAFLVDGLNLHHSALDAEAVAGRRLRRLDVAGLCRSYVHALPGRSAIATIDYFSASRRALSAALATAARELGRELNPALFSPDEYVARRKAGDHFIASVLAAPRVWLIGDDDTLAALG